MLENYREMLDHAEWFRERNVVIIPHGSLVEYLGSKNYRELKSQLLETVVFSIGKVAENVSDGG